MAKRRAKRAGDAQEESESEADDSPRTEVELVRSEIERIRARFGVDPALPGRMLAGAWSAPTGPIEEDEAELVDALADCLSVGLHLGDAVVSWSTGLLARSDEGEEEPEAVRDPDAVAVGIPVGIPVGILATGPVRARRRIISP